MKLSLSVFILASLGFLAVQDQDEDEAPPSSSGKVEVGRLMKTCKKCHLDHWSEWEKSRHAQSWSSATFQAAIQDLDVEKKEACARCHAPDSLLVKGNGELPDARADDRDLGVNCTTCHNDTKRYFGPFESKGHGGIVVQESFLDERACQSCHGHPEANLAHDQYTSFLESPAKAEGKSCRDCHMLEVERKMTNSKKKLRNVQPARKCRTHVFEAAQSTSSAEGAATLAASFKEGRLEVLIDPKTGHALPASEGRELRLEVTLLDAEGKVLGEKVETWDQARKRVLLPGRENRIGIEAPAGATKAKLRLSLVLQKVPGREEAKSLPVGTLDI